MQEFALYKGDEMLSVGTIKEIADEMGVREGTIRFYQHPTYQQRAKEPRNRRVLIKLEDDEES